MVREHIATLREAPSEAPTRPPTVRQVTGWLTRRTPTALNEGNRAGLKKVLAHCPELDTAAGYVRDFGEILTASAPRSLPGSTQSMPARYPASPTSRSTCSGISTLWQPGSLWTGVQAASRAP